jgi:hypothetical protein
MVLGTWPSAEHLRALTLNIILQKRVCVLHYHLDVVIVPYFTTLYSGPIGLLSIACHVQPILATISPSKGKGTL